MENVLIQTKHTVIVNVKIVMELPMVYLESIVVCEGARIIVAINQMKSLLANVFKTFLLHIASALKKRGGEEMIALKNFV